MNKHPTTGIDLENDEQQERLNVLIQSYIEELVKDGVSKELLGKKIRHGISETNKRYTTGIDLENDEQREEMCNFIEACIRELVKDDVPYVILGSKIWLGIVGFLYEFGKSPKKS